MRNNGSESRDSLSLQHEVLYCVWPPCGRYTKTALTVLLRGRALQPEEALVDVDVAAPSAAAVPLPDESQHQVVGESRVRRLHLAQGRAEGLRGGHVAVFQLGREKWYRVTEKYDEKKIFF